MRKVLWLLFLCATACATSNQFGASSGSQNFSIDIPEFWTKLNTAKYFIITRDGPFSQYILIQQRHVNQPFRHTKMKFNRHMLPKQAAQVVLDEITSDQSISNLQVIESLPANVNEYEGFKIVFKYEIKDGLKFRTLYYGFLRDEWFYSLRYNATEKHYSEKDVEAFKRVITSFRIMASGPA